MINSSFFWDYELTINITQNKLIFICILGYLTASLYSCIHVSPYSFIPVSPYSFIPVSLYPFTPVSLCPCTPVSLYPCIPVSLNPWIPESLNPCIPVSRRGWRRWTTGLVYSWKSGKRWILIFRPRMLKLWIGKGHTKSCNCILRIFKLISNDSFDHGVLRPRNNYLKIINTFLTKVTLKDTFTIF